MAAILTPDHERWPEFEDRVTAALAGPEAVATHDAARAAYEAAGEALCLAAVAGCNSHHGAAPAHEASRAVLAAMGFDVAASLAFFAAHGGHCDCEVMLNVVATVERADADDEED
jgi:tryptophan synthase beta subunit